MEKQKPTKITVDDIELVDELSRIATIKGLFEKYLAVMGTEFSGLAEISYQGNPVATHYAILNTQDVLETHLQYLQTDLLRELGQVEEEDAQAIALAQPDDETVPEEVPSTIDETLLGEHDDTSKEDDDEPEAEVTA